MAKVYIVASGTYSDYKIIGIFSTREKAEAFAPHATNASLWGDEAVIEEHELDTLDGVTSLEIFCCQLFVSTGELRREWSRWLLSTEWVKPYNRVWPPGRGDEALGVGRTVEEARKLAVEARQRYLREEALKQL